MYADLKKIFLSVLIIFIEGTFALGFYGNQSDIKWKTASTEHFQFTYPQEYSEHASIVSHYAEAVYDSVVNRYRINLPGKINVTLNNALYSNGSAIPSENSINLWLTNWDFKTRSSHGWLSDVLTHEFSHLVSIENASKVIPNLYGIQISYEDYYNERTTTNFMTLFPFTLQPLWFAEGTAQYESSRMGFDSWDTHRDMLLRTAALNDNLLSLEYMYDFSSNSLHAELGPYTQGFSLVYYIHKKYGENAVPKIWSELSRPHRVTLNAAIKNVLGIDENELYQSWKDEISEQYKNQKDSLGKLVEGIKITNNAFWQDFLVVSGKNIYGVSNFGGLWFDGSIFKISLEADTIKTNFTNNSTQEDTSKKPSSNVNVEQIIVQENSDSLEIIDISKYSKNGFKAKKPWFDKGIDVFESPDYGPILAYISYQNRDKNGHAHFDIAVSDTNKNQASLTYLSDAVYPAFDKQGASIIFARREPFSTRFVLSKIPFHQNIKENTLEEPIDIFVPDSKFKYYNIYSPKFSPNGNKIAFGFFDDRKRGIAIIDADGKNYKIISTLDYDERDVEWIDDNTIIFSSNRNGIFNLFEKNIISGNEKALTNVIGGAFTPVLKKDTIYFTQYDKDGFSLYKIAYNTKKESIVDTTFKITVRDSIIQFIDTTWNNCTKANNDSTISQDSLLKCDSNFILVKRDSILKINDTTITYITRKDSNAITLYGTLPKKIENKIELENRDFSFAEKDYKPIPTIPMFVPMLNFNENAPDLTVFGEGKVKTKAGLLVILSDPLKKNTLQLGLLLELGKGIDYINANGLNPEQEKEFFIAWQNTSTPIDLAFVYSYANYTSKDTVRYEDVRSHGGDSLGMSYYAIPMQSIAGMAGYSLFKSIDTLQIALSYDWADFNLYEDNFSWTYQKRISFTTALGLHSRLENDESNISGEGSGAILYYQYANSDLYRPGTFSESFYVTESGSVKPNYRNFNIHEIGINLYGSLQSPFTGATFACGGKISGIINWNTNAKEDSLDSYYYTPIFLEGYPYLRSSEAYTLAGTKTAMAELHYLFPIIEDYRKSLWIFTTNDLFLDIFAQSGAAWNSKWFNMDNFKNHNFWDRSIGFSLRMKNKIFYSIPLDLTLTFARGLSRIGENSNFDGGKKLKPIDLPLIPSDISPTKIKFSIGMGFNNSWQ